MKIYKIIIATGILFMSLSCNSEKKETAEFFVKFKANNVPYQILFLKPGESGYDQPSDTTTSIRGFEKLTDSVLVDNGTASFSFHFYKHGDASNYKDIVFPIQQNFTLSPKEYSVADLDLDKPKPAEEQHKNYDGLASVNIPAHTMHSWQYSWVKNHRPAKWIITKVDEAAKTISGKFSFTATAAESDGSTDMSKRNTFLEVVEVDITEGEFHLPYSIIKH